MLSDDLFSLATELEADMAPQISRRDAVLALAAAAAALQVKGDSMKAQLQQCQADKETLEAEVARLTQELADCQNQEPPPPPPPEPEPEPEPEPPPSDVAFMTRPSRNLVNISDATDVELSNFSIAGGTVSSPQGIGITLTRVKGAKISFVDFQNLVGGIYLSQCENVVIEDCRGRNIGDGTIGSGHSNYIQFADSRGGAVRRCRFLGGRTEDMVSTWHSGGWGVGQELVIEDNQLEGLIAATSTARHWTSSSGTGIIVSDGGGYAKNGYIIVRRNKLLNPGQVGLQLIDGPGLQVYENIIFGERYSLNNNPITSWEGNPRGVVKDNRYRFIKGDGSEPSPWFHSGSQLQVTNNVRDTTLTAAALKVVL